MNALARRVIEHARAQWRELDAHIAWCDERIAQHARDNAAVRQAGQLMGIGPSPPARPSPPSTTSRSSRTALSSAPGAASRRARTRAAARPSSGGITRRGDTYLRSLLVQGAKSAVMTAHKRSDPISRWTLALRERSGWQVAAVALANKNARILWAVMTKGEQVRPQLCERQTMRGTARHDTRLKRSSSRRHNDEDALTGQTGGGQARLTPGDSNLECHATDWSPAERFASGPARSSAHAACNKAVSRVAVCSSFSPSSSLRASYQSPQLIQP